MADLAPGVAEKLLSIEAVAEWLDVPPATVRKWRVSGTGPRGVRIGKYVRYRAEDVRKWLETRVDPRGAA